MSKIVITGATGHLGGLVVRELLALNVPAERLAVVVRDPNKVGEFAAQGIEIRQGDYDDAASLIPAFEGAAKLLFVSSPSYDNLARARQHATVIEAARNAQVGHIVYTSLAFPEKLKLGLEALHLVTEQIIRLSELPFTFVRNTFYLELLVNETLNQIIEAGEIVTASGGQPFNFALRSDFARATAHVLAGDGHEGKIYELASPNPITYDEFVALLSQVSGKTVKHTDLSAEEAMQKLIAAGVPEQAAGFQVYFLYKAIAEGQFATPSNDLVTLIGERYTPLEQAIKEALNKG